mgnify:CR=1 FL=1
MKDSTRSSHCAYPVCHALPWSFVRAEVSLHQHYQTPGTPKDKNCRMEHECFPVSDSGHPASHPIRCSHEVHLYRYHFYLPPVSSLSRYHWSRYDIDSINRLSRFMLHTFMVIVVELDRLMCFMAPRSISIHSPGSPVLAAQYVRIFSSVRWKRNRCCRYWILLPVSHKKGASSR